MYDIEKEATFVVDNESMADMLTMHAHAHGYLDERQFIRVSSVSFEDNVIVEAEIFRYLDN